MIVLFRRMICLVFAFFLSGCSVHGPLYQPLDQPNKDSSILYIYRPSAFCLGLNTPDLSVNGIKVVKLANNGYTAIVTQSGKYRITVGAIDNFFRPISQTLLIERGKSDYLRYSIFCDEYIIRGTVLFPKTSHVLLKATKEQALLELSNTRYIKPAVEEIAPLKQ